MAMAGIKPSASNFGAKAAPSSISALLPRQANGVLMGGTVQPPGPRAKRQKSTSFTANRAHLANLFEGRRPRLSEEIAPFPALEGLTIPDPSASMRAHGISGGTGIRVGRIGVQTRPVGACVFD